MFENVSFIFNIFNFALGFEMLRFFQLIDELSVIFRQNPMYMMKGAR